MDDERSDIMPDNVLGITDRCVAVLNWGRTRCGKSVVDAAKVRSFIHLPRTLDVALGILSVWIVLGGAYVWADPFGLGRVSDQYSERIIDRVMSAFYDSKGQDSIAVVLIDEDTLAAEDIGWPPPYDYYSSLLYRIMRQNPRAVFVDILLERERPSDRESLEFAREDLSAYVQELQVPLVFVQSSPGIPNLFRGVPGVSVALGGWEGQDYPLVVHPEGSGRDQGDKGYPTAAMKLFQMIQPETALGKGATADLVIQWGCAAPSLAQERDLLPGYAYSFVGPTYSERWAKAAGLLWENILMGLDKDMVDKGRQTVPYTLTVQAHQLAEHRSILHDRVVLVGVHVDGIHDIVDTPVHGQLPGVYKHAMALDNLIKYQDAYYTRPGSGVWVFGGVAVFMSFLSAVLMRRGMSKVLLMTVTMGVVTAVCVVSYFIFHTAPENWVGLALICSFANALQMRC